MNKYELLYIISSSVTEEQREGLIEKIKTLIEKNGGEIAGTEKLGMKKFAYPIDFKTEGFYVLVNFTAKAEAVAVLTNAMNITENVVRQMIIRK
ncbi:MAG: 30S ribosomal protein S6 [Clostridia bacterium]|nr:30S ribosomal protein S6 [Clostridia bacterium]